MGRSESINPRNICNGCNPIPNKFYTYSYSKKICCVLGMYVINEELDHVKHIAKVICTNNTSKRLDQIVKHIA
jgi:hypothetical protein